MGIVYAVRHVLTDECFALKVMLAHQAASPDAIERFKREARTSSRIKSEHVVRVLDADVSPELAGAPYLVMDLLEGVDLEQASEEKAIAKEVVVEWLRQVARPLDKAHRAGIVHRDLKPENLFLTQREDGSVLVKILDFGIAKIAAESTGTTQSGQLLGTPLYMAPEQARGVTAHIGPPTDLYALGLIAYKLLAGAPYWRGTSVAAIIGEILYEPMIVPSAREASFGPEFDAWFLRACNREALLRFESAGQQVEALARALGLPAYAERRAGASSSSGGGDSVPRRAPAGSHPGSSSNVLISSGVTDSAARGRPGTLSSSSTEMAKEGLPPRAKLRRAVLVAVSAALVLSVVLIVFYRRGPARVAASPSAAQSAVTLVATGLPVPSPSPAPVPRAVELAPPSPAPTTSVAAKGGASTPAQPVSARREPVRSPRPPAAAAPKRERAADDVLTDQK